MVKWPYSVGKRSYLDPWLPQSCSFVFASFSWQCIFSKMAFPPLGNSDNFIVSVSINFPSNSKWDALFHHIWLLTYDYPGVGWGSLLWDVPWEDVLNQVLLLLLVHFVSGFRLEMIYISLIISIKSNLNHLHDFQLL